MIQLFFPKELISQVIQLVRLGVFGDCVLCLICCDLSETACWQLQSNKTFQRMLSMLETGKSWITKTERSKVAYAGICILLY